MQASDREATMMRELAEMLTRALMRQDNFERHKDLCVKLNALRDELKRWGF